MRLYGLKSCDSCRNVLKKFEIAGKNIEFIDIRQNPFPAELLQSLLDHHGDAVLVNRRSTTWRNLGDADRQKPAFELLQAYPTLIKRPVIVDGGLSYVGWNADLKPALGLV